MLVSGAASAPVTDLSPLPQTAEQAAAGAALPTGPVAASATPAVPATPAPASTSAAATVPNRRMSYLQRRSEQSIVR